MSHWLKDAGTFVRRNRAVLARRPVWLFSSGPIGTEMVDAKGRDVLEAAEPEEFAEFADAIHPRDQKVFFGAYDPDAEPVGFLERLGARFTRMPAIRKALPAGDFRDWPAIEAWADGIARPAGSDCHGDNRLTLRAEVDPCRRTDSGRAVSCRCSWCG